MMYSFAFALWMVFTSLLAAILSPLYIIMIFRVALRDLSRVFAVYLPFHIRLFVSKNFLILIEDSRNEKQLLALKDKLQSRAQKSRVPQLESISLSFQGNLRLYEVHYVYYYGISLFSLNDVTAIEILQSRLSNRIAAEHLVFQNLSIGIAIFDEQHKLTFCNQEQKKIWGTDIDSGLHIRDILKKMQKHHTLPKSMKSDDFIKEECTRFHNLTETEQQILYLPDGRILQRVTSPYPEGGILQASENVTELTTLEQDIKKLHSVYQNTLRNINSGVAVFSEGNHLQIWNEAFMTLWGLKPDFLMLYPHMDALIDKTLDLLEHKSSHERFKTRIHALIAKRRTMETRIRLNNGAVVKIKLVPISENRTLVIYDDITSLMTLRKARAA